jgi:chemotaxis signal transduction protein
MEDAEFKLPQSEQEPTREQVDWSTLFDAMADMVEVEKVADVLQDRARALAEAEVDAAEAGGVYTLFSLAAERYAMPSSAAREVLELPKVTPVPGTDPVVAGLFHRRGGIYLALNTKRLLGLEEDGPYGNAVVLADEPTRLALLVDEMEAARRIPPADIQPGGGGVVAGVTPDRYIVLDVEALRAEIRAALEAPARGT